MAVQQIIDVTQDLNNNNIANMDVGGYDYAVVQLVAPVGTISFFTTNDSGAVTGVSDGNAESSTNYIAATGVNVATAANVTSLAVAGLVRFQGIGQYLRLSGGTATKALVRLYKIN